MEKILITGASGFLGSHLVEQSLDAGMHVYAGIRKTSNRQYLQDARIKFVFPEYRDVNALRKCFDEHQFDLIVHAAGALSGNTREDYFQVNAEYTRNILQAITNSKLEVKKFLFISSLASYGPADFTKKDIVDSYSDPNPVTIYGESKLKAEQIIMDYPQIPALIFRPTAIFGPRDKELLRLFKTINLGIAPLLGLKKQFLSLIYIKDITRLIVDAALSRQAGKSYFVSDGNIYESKTFNQIIAKALNKNIISLRIPIPLVQTIAWINEMTSKLTQRTSVLNLNKVHELKARNWNCDIVGIKNDFDFYPKYTLEQAVEETVIWYKENQWIS